LKTEGRAGIPLRPFFLFRSGSKKKKKSEGKEKKITTL
jgi:hypothetical protein